MVSGTGDIALDMENQVKANSARIAVLEEQNAALRNSITKVLYAQQKGPKQVQLSLVEYQHSIKKFSHIVTMYLL